MARHGGKKEGGSAERRARQSSDAIAGRVRHSQSQREAVKQAERLADDQAALAQQEAEAEEGGASRPRRRALERKRGKLAARELRLLERDDEAVRQVLERKGRLEGLVSAEGSTDVDELLWFVSDELKLLPVFESLKPPATYRDKKGEVVKRRTNYTPLVLNLPGLMSRFVGVSSNPEVQAALLADERWMGLLGFWRWCPASRGRARCGARSRSRARRRSPARWR